MAKARGLKLSRETLYDLYWNKNMSQTDIAKMLGVHHATVQYWMRKFGIPARSRSQAVKKSTINGLLNANKKREKQIERGVLWEYYWKMNMSLRAIADIFGVDKAVIRNKLIKYNIPRRPKNVQVTPSAPERKLMRLIEKYNLPYRYTGDGSFMIEGLIPDFVCTNGQKILIEIFGRPFHDPKVFKKKFKKEIPNVRTEEYRRKVYEKYGWKMIAIWEEELVNEEQVLNKIYAPKLSMNVGGEETA